MICWLNLLRLGIKDCRPSLKGMVVCHCVRLDSFVLAGKRIAERSAQRSWLDIKCFQAQLSGHHVFGIVLEGLRPKNSEVARSPSMLIISNVKVCSLAIFVVEFEYENVLQVK